MIRRVTVCWRGVAGSFEGPVLRKSTLNNNTNQATDDGKVAAKIAAVGQPNKL